VEQPAVGDGVEAQAKIGQAQGVGDVEAGGDTAGGRLGAGPLEG
jgi:hypothetical protein